MSEKILTIIIPTYNRKDTLARGLETIIPQVIKYADRVDLYISDNCSTDGTNEYIQVLQKQYPGLLSSKRQNENIGADGNFIDAVRSVKTKYVVLFSDDDIMFPNFVDAILTQLDIYPDVGLIHYNSLSISSYKCFLGISNPLVTMGLPKYYRHGGEFIKENMHYASYCSSNVFDRQAFVNQINTIDVESYPGFGWFAILCFSIYNRTALYIDYPLFMFICPATLRWEMEYPLYFAYGLTRLFLELDKKCFGVADAWRKTFSGEMLKRCISLINKYREFYTTKYDLLVKYSPCDEFSRKLVCALPQVAWQLVRSGNLHSIVIGCRALIILFFKAMAFRKEKSDLYSTYYILNLPIYRHLKKSVVRNKIEIS